MNVETASAPARFAIGDAHTSLLQAGALMAVWWLAQTLTQVLGLPIPGSLIGLLALWLLLERGVLRLRWLERGADGLLNHLMLFFVPAMLALVDHPEFLSLLGVKLIVAVLLGTVIVMSGTAFIVELGFRLLYARAR